MQHTAKKWVNPHTHTHATLFFAIVVIILLRIPAATHTTLLCQNNTGIKITKYCVIRYIWRCSKCNPPPLNITQHKWGFLPSKNTLWVVCLRARRSFYDAPSFSLTVILFKIIQGGNMQYNLCLNSYW